VLGTHADNGFLDDVVLFNDGTGDFTRRPRLVLPRPPLAAVLDIETLDINRDGRPDLIIVSTNTSSATGFGVQFLINQGTTFADETIGRLGTSAVVSTGSYCSFIRLADFNGDGWEDFYCSDGPQTVPNRYWMSSGNGNFVPVNPGVLPSGSGLGIHAIDFDGDGRPDLLSVVQNEAADIKYQSFLNRTPFSTLSTSRALLRLSSALLEGNIPSHR
jgi:hypothetical protein